MGFEVIFCYFTNFFWEFFDCLTIDNFGKIGNFIMNLIGAGCNLKKISIQSKIDT